MEMNDKEIDNQKTAENLYSKINIDGKDFKSVGELSVKYQKQVQQIERDSIEKSAYFLCK